MKAYIMAMILLSSVALTHLDTEIDSNSKLNTFSEAANVNCGPRTFSPNLESSFQRESDLSQYTDSQIYLGKTWVVVLSDSFCDQYLPNLIQDYEQISEFGILKGTWIAEFQTGDIAYSILADLQERGYVWIFYPLIEKKVSLRFDPDDSNLSKQWYIHNTGQNNGTPNIDLNVRNVWDTYTGNGVVIGVVDDGIDYNHPDISPNYSELYSHDFCESDEDPLPTSSSEWHGTAIAGIAAAKGNNGEGIAGVSYNSTLAGLRLFSLDDCDYVDEEEYTLNDLIVSQALTYKNQNIDIYSNSWGPDDDGKTLGRVGPLTLAAFEAGVTEGRGGLGSIFVWSNGNGQQQRDNSNKDGYANSRFTISVGAINWQGKQTDYSEYGSNILTSAPSHNGTLLTDAGIFTTDIIGDSGNSEGNYTLVSQGTSTAAPMVSGVIALMLEANPNLTWRDIQHILIRSSSKIDSNHVGWFKTEKNRDYNHAYGYGLLNANTAVNLAEGWTSVADEVSLKTDRTIVDQLILDNNNAGVTSSKFVDRGINIESIEINVYVTHGDRGDLNLFLESPNGVVSELVRENSQDLNSNYHDWTFTSVVHWGENSFGEWKLKVNDTVASGATDRTFNNWSLAFYGTEDNDQDGDGLPDYVDSKLGTGINNPDFDADGILDGDEYYGWKNFIDQTFQTDPKRADSDKDGINDGDEKENQIFSPSIQDFGATNPNDNDTDDDGLLDGEEVDYYLTNPLEQDTDGDTLTDYEEIFAFDVHGRYSSDPTKVDSDNDTIPDLYELNNGLNPMIKADAYQDFDLDGFDADGSGWPLSEEEMFTNLEEYLLGTNPNSIDTDGDGLLDGWEAYWGLDPLSDDTLEDLDNDTLPNIFEYDNRMIESSIFSYAQSSLKALWKFDGTAPTDVFNSANGDINTLFNGAQRKVGKFRSGIGCDGIDDYVRLDSLDPSKLTEYTVQGWVNIQNFSSDFSAVVGTAQDGRMLLGVNAENMFEFRVYSGGAWRISPITNDSVEAQLGIWYNIAATYSEINEELKLYVNGTLISELELSNPSLNTQSSYNYLCRSNSGNYLNGTIDQISIWGRVLSSDEIYYVFKKPKGFSDKAYISFIPDDGKYLSNPNSTDTDGDLLSDREEAYFGIDGFVTDITNPDTDGDTISDYDEVMKYKTSPVTNDTDGDNFTDFYEFELNSTTSLRFNQTGDAFPLDLSEWNDTDGDGVGDNSDMFPFNSSEQYDTDGDTLGDNLENLIGTDPQNSDTDSDGTNDSLDAFPLDPNEYLDTDGDGVGDNNDECPEDKRGSVDSDGDMVCDGSDRFPNNPNEWEDSDGDGYGDNSDAFPDDPSKSLDYEEISLDPQLENGVLDSSMFIIIGIGAIYFLFKRFTK